MSDKVRTNIRYYLPNDPYYHSVDNLPLEDLVDNDVRLQFQIDQLQSQLGQVTGRNTFGDLQAYTSEATPGKIFVRPGNFIARVNTGADRDNGLRERLSDGVHTQSDKIAQAQPEDENYGLNAADEAGGVARTAMVRVLPTDGVDPGVPIPKFDFEDYPDAEAGSNPAPLYRLDLIYIEAYPAEDQDDGRPKVGMIQGGYFMDRPENVASDRKRAQRFTGNDFRRGRTLLQKTEDINQANVISDKKGNISGGTDGLRYTTVPLPEDLKNFIYKPSTSDTGSVVTTPNFSDENSDFDETKIDDWVQEMADTRGVFCLPVCYVLTPFGYTENTHVPTDNLIDIRPFFRTAELALDERQAIATAYQPSFRNRFITRKDPDYIALRDSWVRGSASSSPGNHEGRIVELEDARRQDMVLLDEELELGRMTNAAVNLTPTLTMAPADEEIYALMVRVSIGTAGDTSAAKVKYTNQNGKEHVIGRGWLDIDGGRPITMRTQVDTFLEYNKPSGTSPTSMSFEPISLAGGTAIVYVYGYIRIV